MNKYNKCIMQYKLDNMFNFIDQHNDNNDSPSEISTISSNQSNPGTQQDTISFIRNNYLINANIRDDEIVIVDSDNTVLTSLSDTDFINEYDSDIESNNIYDEINQYDYQHFYSDKEDNKYYLGNIYYNRAENLLLLSASISNNSYFKYSHRDCVRYLYYYGINPFVRPTIDILQVKIIDDCFTVIKKTFWLKIIQRKWKKIYKIRKQILEKRLLPGALLHREIIGKWQNDIAYCPGVHGLLV